jgi:hypothetical protein
LGDLGTLPPLVVCSGLGIEVTAGEGVTFRLGDICVTDL